MSSMIGSLTPQCHTELAYYALHDVAFRVKYHVSPLIGNISRLNRIATLLARCLRLTPTITDDSSRLATVGWLNLNQTGFPPVRLIALGWAHTSNSSSCSASLFNKLRMKHQNLLFAQSFHLASSS